MTDKKLYDFMNDVDIDFDSYEEIKMTDIDKQKAFNDFRNNKQKDSKHRLGLILLALATLVVVFLTPLGQGIRAQTASLIESMTYSMQVALGVASPGQSYSVNETAQLGDYYVKIEDILMDEQTLTLNQLIQSPGDQTEEDYAQVEEIELWVNDQKVKFLGSNGARRLIDDQVFNDLMTYEFDQTLELKDSNKIRLHLKNLVNNEFKPLAKETAEFEWVASKEELAGNKKIQQVNQTLDSERGPLTIDRLDFHPLKTMVTGHYEPGSFQDYLLEVEVRLPDGRTATFDGGSQDHDGFHLNLNLGMSEFTYEEMLEVGEISLQFYAIRFPEESGEMNMEQKEKIADPIRIEIDNEVKNIQE